MVIRDSPVVQHPVGIGFVTISCEAPVGFRADKNQFRVWVVGDRCDTSLVRWRRARGRQLRPAKFGQIKLPSGFRGASRGR